MAQYGTLSANGNTDIFLVRGNDGVWVHVAGTFGAGNFNIYYLGLDGTTWRKVAGTGLQKTADDDYVILLPHGTKIRGTLAGATGPTLLWEFLCTTARF